MYKQCNHKIEGVDKHMVDYLAPNSTELLERSGREEEGGGREGGGGGGRGGAEPRVPGP